jgi:Pyruvate/2-oxoacid:ferredoxin oxidoreductase delta subunit
MVDWASESYCWLQLPGVLDSVSPMAQSSLSHSRLLHFWSLGAHRCVGAGVCVNVCASR